MYRGFWDVGRGTTGVIYTFLQQAHQKFDRLGSCQVNMSKAGASGRNDDRHGSPSLSFRRGTCVRVRRIMLCGGRSRIRRDSSRFFWWLTIGGWVMLFQPSPTLLLLLLAAVSILVAFHSSSWADFQEPIIISEMCDWQPWLCLENTKPFRATFGGKRCPEALYAATSFQCFFSGQTNIKF